MATDQSRGSSTRAYGIEFMQASGSGGGHLQQSAQIPTKAQKAAAMTGARRFKDTDDYTPTTSGAFDLQDKAFKKMQQVPAGQTEIDKAHTFGRVTAQTSLNRYDVRHGAPSEHLSAHQLAPNQAGLTGAALA